MLSDKMFLCLNLDGNDSRSEELLSCSTKKKKKKRIEARLSERSLTSAQMWLILYEKKKQKLSTLHIFCLDSYTI